MVTRPKSKTKPFIAHRVPTSWAAPSCDLSRLAAPALSTAERTSIRETVKLINLNWILPSLEARMVRSTKKIQVRGDFISKWLETTLMQTAESLMTQSLFTYTQKNTS